MFESLFLLYWSVWSRYMLFFTNNQLPRVSCPRQLLIKTNYDTFITTNEYLLTMHGNYLFNLIPYMYCLVMSSGKQLPYVNRMLIQGNISLTIVRFAFLAFHYDFLTLRDSVHDLKSTRIHLKTTRSQHVHPFCTDG